jgi:hypothetical protein
MVAARIDENLGFVFQAPEGLRVHDAIPVALEGRPQTTFVLRV